MKVFFHEDFYRVYTADPAALDFDQHQGAGTVNILGNNRDSTGKEVPRSPPFDSIGPCR